MGTEEVSVSAIESEVKALWAAFEMLQARQDDMSASLQSCQSRGNDADEKFGVLMAEVVDLGQKMLSEQGLRVTDALDYAESEVQDLRSSLEKSQERQAADADQMLQQHNALLEQFELLQTSQDKQSAQVQSLHEQCMRQSQQYGQKLGSLCGANLTALRTQVAALETKFVADVETKLAMEMKECESVLCELDETQACLTDPLQDLQAVVKRQLLEEHADPGTNCVHDRPCDKQFCNFMSSPYTFSPDDCMRRTRPRIMLTSTDTALSHDKTRLDQVDR